MGFTGSYYKCNKCFNIIDYSDSHCPECGSQDETELNAEEVNKIANQLLIIRDFNKNKTGKELLKMLKSHDDLKPKELSGLNK
jgi:RNA polymerase subunit RPABC4/transcription elongation factor Spt4